MNFKTKDTLATVFSSIGLVGAAAAFLGLAESAGGEDTGVIPEDWELAVSVGGASVLTVAAVVMFLLTLTLRR